MRQHGSDARSHVVTLNNRALADATARGFQPRARVAAENYHATPEEIAEAVLYLASDAARWVNGTRLVVDNAMTVMSGVSPPPMAPTGAQ